MKIMLLGGGGFIGLNLANVLVRRGHEVHIADRSARQACNKHPFPDVAGYHLIQSADTARLETTIDELGIECVIGLTSSLIPSSGFSEFDSELSQVIAPTFRLLEHLAKRRISFVFLSSGGTVYGLNNKLVISEDEPLRPISYYGYSKVLFEQYLAFAGRVHQLRYTVIRPSNPFGPFQDPRRKQGLVAVAVDKVLHGQPVEVWGNGCVVRDYIWVEDLAEAVAVLLVKDEAWGRIFNIGSGKGHSVQDLLAMIGALTGKNVEIRYSKSRNVDVPRLVLDITRLRTIINFDPLDLLDALELYLNYTRNDS
jgi:UDP-glucose 4-epimerase